jgi:choline dehydrogenase-like flavoprotein
MGDKGAPLNYGFANHCEQCPNPASRVRLSEKKDAFGQNMTELDWRLCELDIDGIRKAQRVIAREVGRAGIGRMNIFMSEAGEDIPAAIRGVKHHMGTTRMHADPKQGVVDADCRIHGIENIFVAGSSVFPSGGYPNPTLTLTALAVRLADHLKIKFAGL